MSSFRVKKGGHMVDILFTLALFCVFAASALMVVLIGANVYKSTVTKMDKNFNTYTSMTYVSNKLRQHDTADAVKAVILDESYGSFSGTNALSLAQNINNEEYVTLIYYYDGFLKEIFSKKENIPNLTPKEGQSIIAAEGFAAEQVRDNLIKISVVDKQGNSLERLLSLRAG